MPVYEYIAVDAKGKRTKGTLDAESARAARQRLRRDKLFPTLLQESSHTGGEKKKNAFEQLFKLERVRTQDLSVATRQLATLVGAGLPLVTALNALAEQTDSLLLKRHLVNVRENVEEGRSLAKSLAEFPKTFPRLYVNLVAAGEASGTLDVVLEKLADYLERQMRLRRKVRSALTYPVVMLFVCGAVIVGLLVGVIPKIVDIFLKQGATLPLPTQIMLGISGFLIDYWLLLLFLIILGVYLAIRFYKSPKGRERTDRGLLKMPIFAPIYTKVVTARVAGTLGTLLASGVGLLRALDITKNVVGNVHAVALIENSQEGVREGRSLAQEFMRGKVFPVMLSRMIAVGEQSGTLDTMLLKAASAYEEDVESSLEGLTSLLEPLLMIVVGMIVLMIVISVLLPMADLINIVAY